MGGVRAHPKGSLDVTEAMAPAAAAPSAPLNLPRRRVLIIIGALMLGMLLAALDQTIVSTALPTIVGHLGGASRYVWVVTAYLLSSTVSTPLWGKLGDLYGRKTFFQAAIIIFLVGSALSGLSQSMFELIAFRAIQGLGGGGLMVGAQTIIGDIVSPRERGRYMGLFGAMFGVTTVIGPFIGGVITQGPGWRWIFYLNIPIGILALFVTAATLPGHLTRVHRVIDYWGAAFLALGASGLVLFTSLGGTSLPWASVQSIALAAAGVVFTVLFVFVEKRAVEPILPLGLFRNRVFSAASAIGFVMGFAMFGALTFLPLFLQVVKGVSPISSGLRLFPLMGGLLVASVGAGQLVTRWGRYKIFPVTGTAIMSVGLYLMSRIGIATGAWTTATYMFVFGVGLGLVMQVLIVAVQNAVDYEQLGVATSGATFFRMIGGSFGTAVFGAIFSNLILGNVERNLGHVALPHGFSFETISPSLLNSLPPTIHHEIAEGYATTVHSVFLYGVPVCLLAFLLSWLLPEIELRKSVRAAPAGDGFRVPEPRSSLQEVQLALERVARRENRAELYSTLAIRAGLDLDPRSCWLLYRLADRHDCTLESIAARLKVPTDRIAAGLDTLAREGFLSETATPEGCDLELTAQGEDAVERLAAARRSGMTELLEGWDPEAHPELVDMVRRLAHELLADDEKLLADARSAQV
jgi:EmrB/QacA subfamily drug resistance transporter